MEKKGYIYLLKNKINGKCYVGQTARDIWTRFEEHCTKSQVSAISRAIAKYGHNNFIVQELETVPLSQLDEREKYWIKYYNSQEEGYNRNAGGGVIRDYPHVLVKEKNLVVDSIEEFGRIAAEHVGWSQKSVIKKIKEVINTDKTFLDYHYLTTPAETELSDIGDIQNWLHTLSLRFVGKHVYCVELQQEFDTISNCARHLLDTGLVETKSKTPLQSILTLISKQLHGSLESVASTQGPLTFLFIPGSTKNPGTNTPYQTQKVYCPQLDKTFESQIEAAKYMLEQNLWTGIKLKTARLRISDVVNGNFPDYKGYTFQRLEK